MKIQLTQQIIINNKHGWYSMLDELCFKSKNLYNYALYQIRQYSKIQINICLIMILIHYYLKRIKLTIDLYLMLNVANKY